MPPKRVDRPDLPDAEGRARGACGSGHAPGEISTRAQQHASTMLVRSIDAAPVVYQLRVLRKTTDRGDEKKTA